MIKLRNSYPALASGALRFENPASTVNELLVFSRVPSQGDPLTVVINFSGRQMQHTIIGNVASCIAIERSAVVTRYSIAKTIITLPAYSAAIIQIK